MPSVVIGLLAEIPVNSQSDHHKIVAAGWTYRTNERGWTIYREPQTGRWHTRDEAIRKLAPSAEQRTSPLVRSAAESC